ncbi:Putative CBS domain-containing protein [Septoria linicola]|uniref:CBS domain-containing protein n=1 Tax=Septoria linicola TaxID=215465 RepID=A0A9Q9ELB6_9PEZI|nr:Putative CBS domain-containing protein [Septoria linicola]
MATTSLSPATSAAPGSSNATSSSTDRQPSPWASKYRGAVVEDLDPSPAFSTHPHSPIGHALMSALERDYTHLTVIDEHKTLLGYLSVPRLRELLERGQVRESDAVEKAMQTFQRKGRRYKLITMETPLQELEEFFEGGAMSGGAKQEFAVVTDPARRFVLGVATREDLKKFAERRPF